MREVTPRYLPVVVVVAAAVAHGACLANDWVWDDLVYLQKWAANQQSVFDMLFARPEAGYAYYRPLLFASVRLDYLIWGSRPFGFHLTNWLLHVACALGVYVVLKELVAPRAAAVGAVFFAVWPTTVETASWVFARNDSLAALFLLISLWALLRWARRDDASMGLLVAAGGAFACALLSKETAALALVLAPGALFLVDVSRRRRLVAGASYAGVFVLYLLLRTLVVGGSAPASVTQALHPSAWGALLRAFGFYVAALVHVQPYQVFIPAVPDGPAYVVAGLVGLAAIVAAMVWAWTRRRMAVVGGLVAFCVLLALPVATSVSPLSITAVGYRHLYLPLLGLALVVAAALAPVVERYRGPAFVGLGLLTLACLPANVWFNRLWRTDRQFWEHAVEYAPTSHTARRKLGSALARDAEWSRAAEQYCIAIYETQPPTPDNGARAVLALAEMLAKEGELQTARGLLTDQVGQIPAGPRYAEYLWLWFRVQQDLAPEAPDTDELFMQRDTLVRLLRVQPDQENARRALAAVEARLDPATSVPDDLSYLADRWTGDPHALGPPTSRRMTRPCDRLLEP